MKVLLRLLVLLPDIPRRAPATWRAAASAALGVDQQPGSSQGAYSPRLPGVAAATSNAVAGKIAATGTRRGIHDRASHASDVRNSERMWPVVWEALEQWGDDVAGVEPLAGGVANDVWRVRVNGYLAVGRLGARSDADLAWETELLQHLDREGLTVPVPIPTTDGRLFADGLVAMTYVEGGPPETEADWRRVADTLRQLHRLTQGWPQRPGWRSSTDLLHAETGTKIDLGAMPAEGVARCRAAWARLTGPHRCVVHGDPNPGNIRMTADRVALIDWTSRTSTSPTSTWCCLTTPPVSTTARMTSPRKRGPHGKPPSAGTTSTPSSGSPKFEGSEQRQANQETAQQPTLAQRAGSSATATVRTTRSSERGTGTSRGS